MSASTTRVLRSPYPPADPYQHGYLAVGEGHQIYWECSGNPLGIPVLFVHGGPGGGTTARYRQMFDPTAYRIILFDQRGCGRSLPHVADDADLSTNTTWNLVSDIERLREHLAVEDWLLFGGSWGSTLALAYAQKHPTRVCGLILRGVFLCRPSEIDWFYRGGAAHLFPEAWEKYLGPLQREFGAATVAGSEFDPVAAYHELLHCGDPETERVAARAWTTWERTTSTLLPPAEEDEEDRFALAFARIENHYFVHDAFLADTPLLSGMDPLAHTPGVIVHGRYDVVCPVANAWELHKVWPGSRLHIVPTAGHAMSEASTTDALISATDEFRAPSE